MGNASSFKHLRFNSFPMIERTFWGEEFWPLQLCSEDLGVLLGLQFPTWEFTCECEGSFPHTLCTPRSMWSDSQVSLLARNLPTPCLSREPKARVVTQMDFQIFRAQSQGSKPIALESSLYHWKDIEAYMSKMGSHYPFQHLKHKLWPKEKLVVKLAIWLPTTKNRKLTRFPCVQVACNISLKSSWWWLQLCFKLHCNQRFA
jgi:hypothetical protein